MPKKSVNKGGFQGYVDTKRPTREEVDGARKEYAITGKAVGYISELVSGGYNFAVKFDAKRNGYRCELFGLAGSPNDGYILASYAGDVETAVALTLHKHYHHFDGEHWEYPDLEGWG